MSSLTEALARMRQYNSNSFDSLTNPHGFGDDGYEAEFPRSLADAATAVTAVVDLVDMARAAAAQAGAWVQEVLPITRLSDTQIAVTGPEVAALPYKLRRPLKLLQTTPGVGYVAGATFDADAGRVVVTVTGVAVEVDLAEVWLGQDPDNAPRNTAEDEAVLAALVLG
ncbi:hypothetical protein K9F62_09925 [Desulfovibrio sp. JY]|nr:hypothetical protein K9F62_09925 [Desulfovibrio sp. JY]